MSVFQPFKKYGGVAEFLTRTLVERAAGAPVTYGSAYQLRKGIDRHKQTMQAVEEGYPAGWVPLGMRPR